MLSKNAAFQSSFMQKQTQHRPAAAALAAEIRQTDRPPPSTPTANRARENTGKPNAGLQAARGRLYDRSASREKQTAGPS